jgi:type IV pilus assembly protein PilE
MKPRAAGITLVELLVVVTIIGIISSIAFPSYRNYVMRANRSDAKAATLAMATHLERCFTRYTAYNHDDCPVVITGVPSGEGHYTVTAVRTATTFTITATPVGAQAEDPCGSFTLNASNEKNVSGDTQSAASCWQR